MEVSTNLGRVSIAPKGEYDPTASYERLDVVGYEGSSYLVLRSVQGVTPADGQDYMLLAARGQDGEDGTDGAPGENGSPGSSIASIERTEGTGAPGTVDTYTITLTDGSTTSFQVYNGADGQGAGDMTKAVYDPQGKAQDVFQYVDDATEEKQDKLQGTKGQVVGFDEAGNAVPQEAADGELAQIAKETADDALAAATAAQASAEAAQSAAEQAAEDAENALEAAQEAKETAEAAATMEQVNAAIEAAITGAIEEVYYGTESAETAV